MDAVLSSQGFFDWVKNAGGEGTVSFDALGEGVTFHFRAPRKRNGNHRPAGGEAVSCRRAPPMRICFSYFARFTPDLREVVFQGAIDPHTPIAQGWLRASHRKLDARLSTEYRPLPFP